ncbi:unnamed protein product [Trichogramma brassicae]|uniref:Uncharacterized protein n=1 Tax=Trichogramma brassicae TaxID=86971 RepID=A0A6H5I4G7_9HYME|nr:unnamed protein product [Trichogramma brassicae]
MADFRAHEHTQTPTYSRIKIQSQLDICRTSLTQGTRSTDFNICTLVYKESSECIAYPRERSKISFLCGIRRGRRRATRSSERERPKRLWCRARITYNRESVKSFWESGCARKKRNDSATWVPGIELRRTFAIYTCFFNNVVIIVRKIPVQSKTRTSFEQKCAGILFSALAACTITENERNVLLSCKRSQTQFTQSLFLILPPARTETSSACCCCPAVATNQRQLCERFLPLCCREKNMLSQRQRSRWKSFKRLELLPLYPWRSSSIYYALRYRTYWIFSPSRALALHPNTYVAKSREWLPHTHTYAHGNITITGQLQRLHARKSQANQTRARTYRSFDSVSGLYAAYVYVYTRTYASYICSCLCTHGRQRERDLSVKFQARSVYRHAALLPAYLYTGVRVCVRASHDSAYTQMQLSYIPRRYAILPRVDVYTYVYICRQQLDIECSCHPCLVQSAIRFREIVARRVHRYTKKKAVSARRRMREEMLVACTQYGERKPKLHCIRSLYTRWRWRRATHSAAAKKREAFERGRRQRILRPAPDWSTSAVDISSRK